MRTVQLALLAGGAEREMTVREAHEAGLLKPKPRTVEHWRADPDLRRRWRIDLLLERVGTRYYTSPGRIEKWRGALAEREKKAKNVCPKKTNAHRQVGVATQENNRHANSST
jgi:hypothetical protein